MPGKTLTVLYFAWVRDVTDKAQEEIELPPEGMTGRDLVALLAARYPALKPRAERLHLAINQDHAPLETQLLPSDEIALFPPVTGG